jgi:response regulator RpfG family c-di-GMP phosphodiesterase
MSSSDRQGTQRAQSTHFGAFGAAFGPEAWPTSAQYVGDMGLPVGQGLAYEYSFGRSEEYAAPTRSRANATKALLLIDSVRLTRECLWHLLTAQLPDYEIISLANAQQARECGAVQPDVVLLNAGSARLAEGALVDDIATVFDATRRAPTLLLSEHGDSSEESQAAEFGLVGLFPSTLGVSLLVAAIHLVAAGGQFHIPVAPTRYLQTRLEGNGARR